MGRIQLLLPWVTRHWMKAHAYDSSIDGRISTAESISCCLERVIKLLIHEDIPEQFVREGASLSSLHDLLWQVASTCTVLLGVARATRSLACHRIFNWLIALGSLQLDLKLRRDQFRRDMSSSWLIASVRIDSRWPKNSDHRLSMIETERQGELSFSFPISS